MRGKEGRMGKECRPVILGREKKGARSYVILEQDELPSASPK